MRPIIGITSYIEPASWGVWRDLPTALIPATYVESIALAGGQPVLLPPHGTDPGVLRGLDGLVLAGGADVGPVHYGAQAEPRTDVRPDRDEAELALARAALDADLPVFGVCRGMQILAVVSGGRLHQHVPDVVGHDKHRPGPGVYGSQEATFEPGSMAARLMGEDRGINCFHHQSVADPGSLTITGRADDGIAEALEDPARRFLLGVQWHPEVSRDRRLFGALVEAAAATLPR